MPWSRRPSLKGSDRDSLLDPTEPQSQIHSAVSQDRRCLEDLVFQELEALEIEESLAFSELPSPDPTDAIRQEVNEGCELQRIVDEHPNEVLNVLKNLSVVKLGSLKAPDSQVLAAFGTNEILTRGSDLSTDEEWEEAWRLKLETRAQSTKSNIDVGWEEMVSLGAYVVMIKDIASRQKGALLALLLQKYSSRATSKKIWDFPCVRALINYHWQHWARRLYYLQAMLFLGWLFSFCIYLGIYNATEDAYSLRHLGGSHHSRAVTSHIMNFISFFIMIPFALIEGLSMIKQKARWIRLGNILDCGTIVLQFLKFVCQLKGVGLNEEWFAIMLAVQCTFMFLRFQNFCRVIWSGYSLGDLLSSVIFDARYLIFYIFLTGISASLYLGAIYKHDEDEEAFKNNFKSLVSTYCVLFDGYQPSYILQSDTRLVKFIFLFGLHLLMSITVLNLLIAIITESYSEFVGEQRVRYNKCRASMIDEFEALGIPELVKVNMHRYIHFLVVEKRQSQKPGLEALPCVFENGSGEQADDTEAKIKELTLKINMMVKRVEERTHKGGGGVLGHKMSTISEAAVSGGVEDGW